MAIRTGKTDGDPRDRQLVGVTIGMVTHRPIDAYQCQAANDDER
jgi:hypothetical protein